MGSAKERLPWGEARRAGQGPCIGVLEQQAPGPQALPADSSRSLGDPRSVGRENRTRRRAAGWRAWRRESGGASRGEIATFLRSEPAVPSGAPPLGGERPSECPPDSGGAHGRSPWGRPGAGPLGRDWHLLVAGRQARPQRRHSHWGSVPAGPLSQAGPPLPTQSPSHRRRLLPQLHHLAICHAGRGAQQPRPGCQQTRAMASPALGLSGLQREHIRNDLSSKSRTQLVPIVLSLEGTCFAFRVIWL